MKNLEGRLSAVERQVARTLKVRATFHDKRTMTMEFLQAVRLFLDDEIVIISALDHEPQKDPLSELTLEELRALLPIVEKMEGDLKKCERR